MMHRFGHHWIYGHPWGGGFVSWPGILLSGLSTLFLLALFIGLVGVLLSLIMLSIRPMMTDIFGTKSTDALDLLRMRYAAGEIDAVTFEQMRERLMASYQQESDGMPHDVLGYQEEHWTGDRNT